MARTFDHGADRAFRPTRWGWFALLRSWSVVAQQRRRLAALDDHLLKDLGLTRADVEAEVQRSFWDVGLRYLNRGERL